MTHEGDDDESGNESEAPWNIEDVTSQIIEQVVLILQDENKECNRTEEVEIKNEAEEDRDEEY